MGKMLLGVILLMVSIHVTYMIVKERTNKNMDPPVIKITGRISYH